ncbi:MAG: hypothetical protein ING69_17885, partial [Rhodocyclaceae bacterium]|nr:hypothetical protein [Rhodocyclaceae bacterium]
MSAVVLVCFTSVTLSPAMAAIQSAKKATAAITATGTADPMGAALIALEDALKQISPSAFPVLKQAQQTKQTKQTKRATGSTDTAKHASSASIAEPSVTPEALLALADTIATAAAEIDKLAESVEAEFTDTGERLLTQNLPPVILERHREAVATFNARRAELKRLANAIDDARPGRILTALGKRTATPENTASLQTAIGELGRFMAAYPNQRAHSQTDPYNLPFRIASDKVRKAAETEAELNAVLSRTADTSGSTIAATKTAAIKTTANKSTSL